MILARCPACSTTFRVRPEQLNARHGRVRCGQCQHAFNALENQVEEETLADELPSEPVQVPTKSAPPSLFVLQEKLPEATDILAPSVSAPPSTGTNPQTEERFQEDATALVVDSVANHDVQVADAPRPPQPEADAYGAALETPELITFEDEALPSSNTTPTIPEIADDRIEPVGEIRLEALDERPEEDMLSATEATSKDQLPPHSPLDEDEDEDEDEAATDVEPPVAPFPFKPDWPDASELDLKNPPDPSFVEDGPLDFDSLLHKKVVDDTPGTPQQALDQDRPSAPTVERPSTGLPIEPRTAVAVTSEPPELEQDEHVPFVEEMEEPTGPSPLQQAAWAAGATLLVLALLAQGILVFRSEIAQSSPQMRLFMESVCAGMGCELPLPRESASITIESSDIQPDANREAFFTLHATLRNRAEFAQAWPHLEITLTDARDKALVRRVLEPKQWLPADMPPDAFPARKEVAAQVRFEAPGVAAAGYRVYAFYP
ncbi:MAG: zinc-ribbon domain-containing protein [Proteobacteria bacterium]|nr:zinc-ribbon domain-containing protein [Pseudomonadota bacterium]